jgi:hypothetical protein
VPPASEKRRHADEFSQAAEKGTETRNDIAASFLCHSVSYSFLPIVYGIFYQFDRQEVCE